MAFDPTFPRGCRKQWIAAALVLIGAVGCQKMAPIGRYQVPKEETTASASPESPATGPDRMVAAIVPHAGAAWFFKLAGPTEAVGKFADGFETFIKSVAFPGSTESQPKWTLPAGWKQTSGGADLRFATLTISEKPPLEVTVTTLPWPQEHDLEQLLSNVNRWRGQMALKPLDTVDLADQIRSLTLAGDEAILVDFHGTLKPGGMQPPVAAAVAGNETNSKPGEKSSLPAGHPPIADNPPVADQNPVPSRSGKDFPRPDQPDVPLTFTAPDGWTASRLPPFAVVAFTRTKDAQAAEITVSPFGGAAGGLLANVNRWRAQLKLPEITSDQLDALVKPYQVAGQPAQMVQLLGPEAASPRMSIVVVMAVRGNVTWFFRMRGDSDLCKAEQSNFEKLVASIKFREEEE